MIAYVILNELETGLGQSLSIPFDHCSCRTEYKLNSY